MKAVILTIMLAASLMTSAFLQSSMPINVEKQNIVDVEESMDIQTQIEELLQTDGLHAKQAMKELSEINLAPDRIVSVEQVGNGYFQMSFEHDGKRYTAELTRKKYIDCVTDENGKLVFAATY